MAEHILRRELRGRGVEEHHVRITSAGIAPYARDGALVSLDTRLVLRDVGIDIGEEATSNDLKRHPEMLEDADLVIAMTQTQARELVERFPGAAGRTVHTMRSIAGEAGDIDDPYEKGDLVFGECRDEIARLISILIDRILADENE
jgi:protein-tyrosine-phosphatase